MLKKLYKYIKKCYGYSSRSKIPIVIRNESGDVLNFKSTHDGKEILKAFAASNSDSYELKSILDVVETFESNFGDGTSLLILLILDLNMKTSKIKSKELNIVLDKLSFSILRLKKIFKDINKNKKIKNSLDLKENWIRTVCRGEYFYKNIYEAIKEGHRIANIYENVNKNIIKEEDKCEVQIIKGAEISHIKRNGFVLETIVHPKYTTPNFKRSSNCDIFINFSKSLALDEFLHINASARRRTFVICRNYDIEIEDYINTSSDLNIVVIRTPMFKEYLLEDLCIVLNAETDIETGITLGRCKNVIIEDKSVLFSGFNNKRKNLEEYCINLSKNLKGDSNDLVKVELRTKNILKNNVVDIIITSESASIRSDIKCVVEDIQKSEYLIEEGYIEGAFEWLNDDKEMLFNNSLIESLKRISDVLNYEGETANYINKLEHPVDLYECIKNAIITAVNYHNNRIDTLEEVINVDYKKYFI